ncbi:hypothetical protein [Microbacterium sp. SORGH_AS_0888]|uniref:hypothetical protein n=1 Tax=Microbacterium sp. SORGH_AS_0888 TaxID=3041791 RepID=UPI00278B39ED|nr:hypothetical protein [Microbacterium sp. SORGH_AS_0888]MDQ1127939.1 MinD-like ATPase involved in chromosome partitioning or flagellar assembly [Microbacterium sp. SORGH_AS_0888]
MTRVVLVLPEPTASRVAAELTARGATVSGIVDARAPASLPDLADAELVVVPASRELLTAELVALADRAGVRVVPVAAEPDGARRAAGFGLAEPLPPGLGPRRLAVAILRSRPAASTAGVEDPATIAVWGPHGAPGRTTIAIELATELARDGRHLALVDADAHAPSIAQALALPDEGPGLPAACRQAELGGLDHAELSRISVPLAIAGRDVSVLVGINRPARWPELSARRISAVLGACRSWARTTIVDVAASLERDEEIVSDLADGPRRNAATLATLAACDRVVAVAAAEPVGIARFVRGYTELRAAVGPVPVTVVVNRLRAGAVGLDARGQIRRTLERYADLTDVLFVPDDPRAADAARLAARPVSEVAARSPLVAAVRRVAAELSPSAALPTTRRAARRALAAAR